MCSGNFSLRGCRFFFFFFRRTYSLTTSSASAAASARRRSRSASGSDRRPRARCGGRRVAGTAWPSAASSLRWFALARVATVEVPRSRGPAPTAGRGKPARLPVARRRCGGRQRGGRVDDAVGCASSEYPLPLVERSGGNAFRLTKSRDAEAAPLKSLQPLLPKPPPYRICRTCHYEAPLQKVGLAPDPCKLPLPSRMAVVDGYAVVVTAIVAIIYSLTCIRARPAWSERGAIVVALYAERAANLASGVSPIVPALGVLASLWFTAVYHLRRIRWLADDRSLLNPFPNGSSLELAGLHRRAAEVVETLERPPVWWWGWFATAIAAFVLALLVFAWPRETFETEPFMWFVRYGVIVILVLMASTFIQVLAVW